MAKKVTMDMLKQENQMYQEFVEIPVTFQDQEYSIKLYPFFKPEKIRDLVNELTEFYKNCPKEKLEVPQVEQDDIVGFFMVKYFTNLKFTKSKKAKKIYEEFKIALNSKVFKLLLQAFPQDSVKEVYERIYEVIEAGAKLETMITNMQQDIKELPLENKDILFGNEDNVENKPLN